MDEHEGDGVGFAQTLLKVQRDSGCHFDSSLVRDCGRVRGGLDRWPSILDHPGAFDHPLVESTRRRPGQGRGGWHGDGARSRDWLARSYGRSKNCFPDMARFYRDTLGLTPRSSKDDFINFRLGRRTAERGGARPRPRRQPRPAGG